MVDIEACDIVIVGGGPAGATAANLLSREGRSVVLFEKGHHPRFHIGESLLPMNIPILDRLGVLEGVRRIGTHKPGADFTADEVTLEYHSFPFSQALGDTPEYAFQVRRSEFDALLFEACRARGASVTTGAAVTRVELAGNGHHKVHAVLADGDSIVQECRYVLDASGQDTVLASQEKWRRTDRRHRAAALFSHFEGVEERTGADTGNISIYWFDHGWLWMIPLPNGVMSVGAVCSPSYLRTRSGSRDEFLRQTIDRCAGPRQRMQGARQIQPTRAAANYSYYSRRQVGPGYALIGDAYRFIDPVFSSGVYLAMSSAERVVPLVNHWLNGELRLYRRASRRYRREINRGIATFSWFIYRFTSPAMAMLFRNPRNTLKVEQAVISMLAGNVYHGKEIRLRLMLFKCIYAVARSLVALRQLRSPRIAGVR